MFATSGSAAIISHWRFSGNLNCGIAACPSSLAGSMTGASGIDCDQTAEEKPTTNIRERAAILNPICPRLRDWYDLICCTALPIHLFQPRTTGSLEWPANLFFTYDNDFHKLDMKKLLLLRTIADWQTHFENTSRLFQKWPISREPLTFNLFTFNLFILGILNSVNRHGSKTTISTHHSNFYRLI